MRRARTPEDYRANTACGAYRKFEPDAFTAVCSVCWRSAPVYGGRVVGAFTLDQAFVCARCKGRVTL